MTRFWRLLSKAPIFGSFLAAESFPFWDTHWLDQRTNGEMFLIVFVSGDQRKNGRGEELRSAIANAGIVSDLFLVVLLLKKVSCTSPAASRKARHFHKKESEVHKPRIS